MKQYYEKPSLVKTIEAGLNITLIIDGTIMNRPILSENL